MPYNGAKCAVSIADQIGWCCIPGERFRDLARNPLRRRAARHSNRDEFSATEPDNREAVEKAECKSWNDKQIHGRDLRRMVAEKRPPALAPWSAAPDHVLGDS
jgi:hypothetical protein